MYLLLAVALLVVFLLVFTRQSGSIQSRRKSRKTNWPDSNSDVFLMSTDHQNAPVVNHAADSLANTDLSGGFADHSSNTYSTGGELGTALADAIDGGGGFDSGSSDFGGGGTVD